MSQGQNFLPKFLFVSNLLKAVKIRQRVPNDVVKPSKSSGLMHHLRGMHRYTLEMIAMNHFPQAFREVVQAAILDRAMQTTLEQEKKLNWCREVKKMVPLRTNGKTELIFAGLKEFLMHTCRRVGDFGLFIYFFFISWLRRSAREQRVDANLQFPLFLMLTLSNLAEAMRPLPTLISGSEPRRSGQRKCFALVLFSESSAACVYCLSQSYLICSF